VISPFGVDHGDISKGLPSAVKRGGGGLYGRYLKSKNISGKGAAKWKAKGQERISENFANIGRSYKGAVNDAQLMASVRQPNQARRLRAELLNADGKARRAGYKTGKSSGLKTGYRGRIGQEMKKLP